METSLAKIENENPDEIIALYLSGCCGLEWKKGPNGLKAENSVLKQELYIGQESQGTTLSSFGFETLVGYRLYVKNISDTSGLFVEPIAITIRTGDYNRECDRLLSQLFRIATQKSHISFLGL